MIYLVIIIYLIVLVYNFDYKGTKTGRTINYWLCYVVLVLLVSLRYRVGGDTINYITTYDFFTPELQNLEIFTITNRQPIPAFLFSFVKTYLNDFVFIQLIIAIFVNFVVFRFVKDNTKYCFTAIFLYGICFYMRFNCEIMRESIAVAFFLLGYKYLAWGKYVKYYLFTLLAFMSHASAIMLFILPFMFSSVKLKWKIIVGVIIICCAGFIVQGYISALVLHYIERYSEYNSTIWGKLSIALFQIIIPYFFVRKSTVCCKHSIINGVYVYIICGIASLVFYILYRFNNYAIIFYIIMMSDLLNYTLRKYHYSLYAMYRNLFFTLIFCYSFVAPFFQDISRYTGYPSKWYSRWYPYYSIMDPKEDTTREIYIERLSKY